MALNIEVRTKPAADRRTYYLGYENGEMQEYFSLSLFRGTMEMITAPRHDFSPADMAVYAQLVLAVANDMSKLQQQAANRAVKEA